jgi:antirestriction protein ArdC
MKNQEMQIHALTNAVQGQSLMNYQTIIESFVERGIPLDEIVPRENVFTFNAWKALGRVVRKAEKGVPVVTFVKCKSKTKKGDGESAAQEGTGDAKGYSRPHTTYVFHISQTDSLN